MGFVRFIVALVISLLFIYLGLSFIEYDFTFSLADYSNEIRIYILVCFLVVLFFANGILYSYIN